VPHEKEREEKLDNVQINARALLLSDLGYYTFTGSLTTPPRTENVTWFVLKQPVTVSAAEIQRFEKLYRHDARVAFLRKARNYAQTMRELLATGTKMSQNEGGEIVRFVGLGWLALAGLGVLFWLLTGGAGANRKSGREISPLNLLLATSRVNPEREPDAIES
jgi:hypothetical protein